MPSYFLNSLVLFNIAKRAATDKAVNPGIVATIFSVVAAEAFINEEMGLACDVVAERESEPQRLRTFAEMEREVEEAHGSLQLKCRIAKWVFSGEAFDKGANLYQDFDLLIGVRNAIIHYKLWDRIEVAENGSFTMETPKLLDRLKAKNVLAEIPETVNASWLHRIDTPKTSLWACRTTSNIVRVIATIAPEGMFKTLMGHTAKLFKVKGDE